MCDEMCVAVVKDTKRFPDISGRCKIMEAAHWGIALQTGGKHCDSGVKENLQPDAFFYGMNTAFGIAASVIYPSSSGSAVSFRGCELIQRARAAANKLPEVQGVDARNFSSLWDNSDNDSPVINQSWWEFGIDSQALFYRGISFGTSLVLKVNTTTRRPGRGGVPVHTPTPV